MNERRYSEIASWLKCPRQHHYAWRMGLELLQPNFKMIYGLLFHKGMEAYWKDQLIELEVINYGKELQAKYASVLIDEDLEIINRQTYVAIENVVKAIKEFKCDKYVCLGAELEIEFHPFVGHVDVLLRDKETNEIWVVDYKTRAKFKDEEEELFNLQLAIYTKILQKNKFDIAGAMIWQVSNKQEEKPYMLKNGTMSRAKIYCPWETYKKELLNNGLEPLDYFDMERKLEFKSEFNCIINRTDKVIIDNIFLDVEMILNNMSTCNNFYRNLIPNNCNFCDYKKICHAELCGMDTDLIKKMYYTERVRNVHNKEKAQTIS